MFFIKLNKWILSLAIIASATAYSGYAYRNVPSTFYKTELVVEKPISETSIYYFSSTNISGSFISDIYKFSFQSFIINYNITTSLQIETSNYNSLRYFDTICCVYLLSCLNQDDYHDIFIG